MRSTNTVGEKLRTVRKQQGIPILLLAKLARVSPHTISLFENYGVMPHPRAQQAIAQVLGVPVHDIFPQETTPCPENA